jgi:hypothetical protein
MIKAYRAGYVASTEVGMAGGFRRALMNRIMSAGAGKAATPMAGKAFAKMGQPFSAEDIAKLEEVLSRMRR